MANIGSFKKVGNDFQGEIVTLSLQAKGVRIVAETSRSNETLRATASTWAGPIMRSELLCGFGVGNVWFSVALAAILLRIITGRCPRRRAVWRGAAGADQRDQIRANSPFSPSKRLA